MNKLLLLALACLSPWVATPTWATTRCVNTSETLVAALRDFSLPTPGQTDYTIQIEAGTYEVALDNPILELDEPAADGHSLRLLGGYDADCNVRSENPFATVIHSSALFVDIRMLAHDLLIDGITFDAGIDEVFGLTIRGPVCSALPGIKANLRRMVLRNQAHSTGLSIHAGCWDIRIENSLIEASVDISKFGASPLSKVELVNNTIAYAAGQAGLGLSSSDDVVPLYVKAYNNVFIGQGLSVSEDEVWNNVFFEAFNNTWDSIDIAVDAGGANSIDDPQVDADYRPVEPTSPLINSGHLTPPGGLPVTDIRGRGHVRVLGTTVDRGAYESSINNVDTYVVTNRQDAGTNSLRWGIEQANVLSTTSRIAFDIDGACPRIIELDSPLPSITANLSIAGYSQPGSVPARSETSFDATLCIGVKGDGSTSRGLRLSSTVDDMDALNVSGIGFGGFNVAAIEIAGGAGSQIHGNQFGGTLGGMTLGDNVVNVRIGGTSHDNQIGGDSPESRNLIMFATSAGIELLDNAGGAEGYANQVVNNLIGTDASGEVAAGNNIGIRVRSHDNVIKGNVISGNVTDGVVIEGALANFNEISSNRIGLKVTALCTPLPCEPDDALGNDHFGVLVDGGNNSLIQFNEVAYNGSKGIRLFEGQRNRLLGNSVHDNVSFGIDVGVSGVNPQYPATGSDQLANNGINTPHIAAAGGGQRSGQVIGSVTTHSGTYVMQAFSNETCDATGYGEGQTLIGTKIIDLAGPPGSGGFVQWDMPVSAQHDLKGRFISTTWFDADGNSSEFSNCVAYQLCDTIYAHDFDSGIAETCE